MKPAPAPTPQPKAESGLGLVKWGITCAALFMAIACFFVITFQ